jgi:hypothetical protein
MMRFSTEISMGVTLVYNKNISCNGTLWKCKLPSSVCTPKIFNPTHRSQNCSVANFLLSWHNKLYAAFILLQLRCSVIKSECNASDKRLLFPYTALSAYSPGTARDTFLFRHFITFWRRIWCFLKIRHVALKYLYDKNQHIVDLNNSYTLYQSCWEKDHGSISSPTFLSYYVLPSSILPSVIYPLDTH